MKIKPSAERRSPNAEKTRFERIQLEGGQLSVVRPLPPDFPPDFAEQLIKEEAWNKKGKVLDPRARKPELIDINGIPLVRKRCWETGSEVKEERNKAPRKVRTMAYTPSAQITIVDEAKRRYKEAYGKDLPVEEPVAFYIDKETTQKYIFYRYYKEIEKGKLSGAQKEKARNTIEELDEQLWDVGVDRGEQYTNRIIVEDLEAKDGFKLVLIDTEFWTVSD